jgi:hypothetical protein
MLHLDAYLDIYIMTSVSPTEASAAFKKIRGAVSMRVYDMVMQATTIVTDRKLKQK